MGLAIVYLPGTSHHLFNQSASLVADRIARSIQRALQGELPFQYRVSVKSGAHQYPPEIPVDVASIEVAAIGEGATSPEWRPAIDVLELKYLPRFKGTFSRLSALARAIWAFRAFLRSKPLRAARALQKSTLLAGPGDKRQAGFLAFVVLVLFTTFLYWLAVGLTALFGLAIDTLTDGFIVWTLALGLVGFLGVVFKHWIDSIEKTGVEYVVRLDYFNEPADFDVIHDAVRDIVSIGAREPYAAMDLLSFSLGAVIATNVIHPPGVAAADSPVTAVRNWVTIGHPFDLVEATRPGFFKDRSAPATDAPTWINVVVPGDFIATDFSQGPPRGIGVSRPERRLWSPNINVSVGDAGSIRKPRREAGTWRDWIPLNRVTNHMIYWDDQDPRTPSCFDRIVGPAGWADCVRSTLAASPQKASPQKASAA